MRESKNPIVLHYIFLAYYYGVYITEVYPRHTMVLDNFPEELRYLIEVRPCGAFPDEDYS